MLSVESEQVDGINELYQGEVVDVERKFQVISVMSLEREDVVSGIVFSALRASRSSHIQ